MCVWDTSWTTTVTLGWCPWLGVYVAVTPTKEAGGQGNAALPRKRLDMVAERPRDPVALPLVDGFPVYLYPASGKFSGNGRSAAELLHETGMRVDGHAPIVRTIFGVVNPENALDDTKMPWRENSVQFEHETEARMEGETELKEEAGMRLRQVRIALGYAVARRFAENTGVTEDNLSSWERGVALVPAYYVQKLKELFGVTHDFIYGGDAASLKHELAMKVLSTDKRVVP